MGGISIAITRRLTFRTPLSHTRKLCMIGVGALEVQEMANDVVPTGGSFLDELNLPKIVAGPAGEAIARLIGGAVDIPAAWLNRVAQASKIRRRRKP
jgi:hypothetical protein